jgi:pimeloyl-ACP methyl ester carboxylesterase
MTAIKPQPLITRPRIIAIAVGVALLGMAFLVWQWWQWRVPGAPNVTAGKFPEELVYVRSRDDIVNGGAIFTPPKDLAKPIAVIWIHGWGVNFYYPTYVMIGRALAQRAYTCITANTRMHDLGNVAGWRGEKRIRGGGYWGVASEEVRDLAAWIDFAEDRGFKKVVLVGHSAGWAAVRRYQAEKQDQRVVGLALASGAVRAETRPTDPDQLAQATRLMADGQGDDLVRDPKRSFPSFISAATFMDIANTPPQFKDFLESRRPTRPSHKSAVRFSPSSARKGTLERKRIWNY